MAPPPWRPPLTLYLHIPYCVRKCPYCDFPSHAVVDVPEQRYQNAVLQELEWRRQHTANDSRALRAIFFGGGTPSLFHPGTIRTLLERIRTLWPLSPYCEITLEANPESATREKMDQWLAAGINRLSLGIQAFDDQRLNQLGRPHNLAAARSAIRHARPAGFQNLSLDLIYATPGQTEQQWSRELAEAITWQPNHLSCYPLAIEPGTFFAQQQATGARPPPNEEQFLTLFQQTRTHLAQAGYPPYEISNFAPPAATCRHNLNYWRFGDYLGIGAGAHGKSTQTNGQTHRSTNPAAAETYMTALEQNRTPPPTAPPHPHHRSRRRVPNYGTAPQRRRNPTPLRHHHRPGSRGPSRRNSGPLRSVGPADHHPRAYASNRQRPPPG